MFSALEYEEIIDSLRGKIVELEDGLSDKDETRGYGEPHDWTYVARNDLLDECADVIQATLNLVAALGVEDFRPYMKACEERNRERGRITK